MARTWPICVIAVLVGGGVLVGGEVGADGEGTELFEEFYAPRIQEARTSRDSDRALALARELLEGAGESGIAADLRRRKLEAAHDLAASIEAGREIAIDAARSLADHFPEHRESAYERLVTLRQRHFARTRGEEKVRAAAALVADLESAADHQLVAHDAPAAAEALLRRGLSIARSQRLAEQTDLAERIQAVSARRRAQRNVERIEANLRTDPGEPGLLRGLVMAYVVDLDRPAEAAAIVSELADEQLERRVQLAARPISELEPAEALGLGQWYRELAGEVDDAPRRAPLLARAQDYYRYYLDADESGDDERRTRVRLLLEDLADQEAQLGAASILPSRHVQAVWTIVFESDDPLDWDPGDDVPDDMRYVRLRRMDSGEFVIISVAHEQFRENAEGERFIWNGTSGTARGVHYLGIANKQWRNPYRQGGHIVQVTSHRDGYGGWGFGRKSLINSDQIQMWADEVIETDDMVVMQIAVTPGPLNSADRQRLLE